MPISSDEWSMIKECDKENIRENEIIKDNCKRDNKEIEDFYKKIFILWDLMYNIQFEVMFCIIH